MDKGYIHVEIVPAQSSKKANEPCGDVFAYDRTQTSTTLILSDGIGHGIKAHVAAQMCVSRLLELLRQGFSMRKAFAAVVHTMNQAKGTDMPYAVFTMLRILNDGVASVLTYDMPAPLLVTSKYAQVLPQRMVPMENALVGEANCHLESGEGIVLVTDGITQAGLGMGLSNGWTIEGVSDYIRDCLTSGAKMRQIPGIILKEAREVWKTKLGDDCTVVLAGCRRGKTVNILTGPPSNHIKDRPTVQKFLRSEGTKVVCGGTTAKIVADYLGKEVEVEINSRTILAPAGYKIDGIDLVTEGAVTLNQVYNVLDEDPDNFDEISGVTELHELLHDADKINLMIGGAVNPASRDISFRQKGILTRHAIVPLIADKLRKSGKLVVMEAV